jgi:hypothetical protein
MAGKIDVDELRVGMFIHLDLSWMQHPFPVGSFRITHEQQIDKIRGLGLKQLRWSPEKSALAPPPTRVATDNAAAPTAAAIELPPETAAQASSARNAPRPSCAKASSTKPAMPGARLSTAWSHAPSRRARTPRT